MTSVLFLLTNAETDRPTEIVPSFLIGRNQSMWADRERPICRSVVKHMFVTPAPASRPHASRYAPAEAFFWNVPSPLRSRFTPFSGLSLFCSAHILRKKWVCIIVVRVSPYGSQIRTFAASLVSTSASDWLERLVSEMTFNVLMGTLNPTHSTQLHCIAERLQYCYQRHAINHSLLGKEVTNRVK